MKKAISVFALLPFVMLSCKQKNNTAIVGKWQMTIPQYKLHLIEKAYEENLAEIESLQEVPDYFQNLLGKIDLDSFKAMAKAELKQDYNIENRKAFVYEYTKDGYTIFTNLAKNKSDTIYKYSIIDNNLSIVPVHNLETIETIFADSVNLYIVPTHKDTLMLTFNHGSIIDTFLYTKFH